MIDSAVLQNLSPLDGRYAKKTKICAEIFSESGLMRYRVKVEITWLLALFTIPQFTAIHSLTSAERTRIQSISDQFNTIEDTQRIKGIEKNTQHDVKAVEYFIKEKLQALQIPKAVHEFVHFACTSEDINNVAYALMLHQARQQILLPSLEKMSTTLCQTAQTLAATPMLARTHGQTATPTTMGKELANVLARLQRQKRQLQQQEILAKFNGAVGNFNAHHIAFPEVDWPVFTKQVIEILGLQQNTHTTQIEPHDWIAEYSDIIRRINIILIDFSRDIWGYIALGYFKQAHNPDAVGSSTMPHKINPIDFENAEGNLGLANALLAHFSEKLPISRWQRDLSDSTVLRSIGSALGYTHIAWQALNTGLQKLSIHPERLQEDLNQSWEVLAEAIQTVMRRYGLPEPYEQLKALTKGQIITQTMLHDFIATLTVPENIKSQLQALTPSQYVGLAEELVYGA